MEISWPFAPVSQWEGCSEREKQGAKKWERAMPLCYSPARFRSAFLGPFRFVPAKSLLQVQVHSFQCQRLSLHKRRPVRLSSSTHPVEYRTHSSNMAASEGERKGRIGPKTYFTLRKSCSESQTEAFCMFHFGQPDFKRMQTYFMKS